MLNGHRISCNTIQKQLVFVHVVALQEMSISPLDLAWNTPRKIEVLGRTSAPIADGLIERLSAGHI